MDDDDDLDGLDVPARINVDMCGVCLCERAYINACTQLYDNKAKKAAHLVQANNFKNLISINLLV